LRAGEHERLAAAFAELVSGLMGESEPDPQVRAAGG
jgi:hypothetical protein